MFQVSKDEALLALAASGVVGSLIGMGLSRLTSEGRLAAMADKFIKAKDLAAAAAEAAGASETELKSTRERLESLEVDVGRLQAEANRLPALDATISELRGELSRTSDTLAAAQARAERIPSLETSLDRSQVQLHEAAVEKATLQVRADQVAPLESSLAQLQARVDQMQTALAEAEQDKARLAVRIEEASVRSGAQLARLGQLEATLAEAERENARLATRLEETNTRAGEHVARMDQLQAALAQAEQDKIRLASRAEETTLRAGDLHVRLDQLQAALADADRERSRLSIQVEEEAQRSRDLQAMMQRTEAAAREALSSELLATSQQAFLDAVRTALGEFERRAGEGQAASQAAIETLVAPMRDSVSRLRVSMQGLEARGNAHEALAAEIADLRRAHEELRASAEKLAGVLAPRDRSERWGEIPLRRLVEMAGVGEHCHFDALLEGAAAEGRLRPDAVVHLPGVRRAVIDAKAPLAAYFGSLEAVAESDRRNLLRVHAASLRDHVSQLGGPAYRAQLPSSTDLVIMYLPLEGALAAAVEEDPGLIDHALGYSVIPATPLTLLAHLKTAAWMGTGSGDYGLL